MTSYFGRLATFADAALDEMRRDHTISSRALSLDPSERTYGRSRKHRALRMLRVQQHGRPQRSTEAGQPKRSDLSGNGSDGRAEAEAACGSDASSDRVHAGRPGDPRSSGLQPLLLERHQDHPEQDHPPLQDPSGSRPAAEVFSVATEAGRLGQSVSGVRSSVGAIPSSVETRR